MELGDLLSLLVWIVVILSYVLRIAAKGFKQAEEEARRKAAARGARSSAGVGKASSDVPAPVLDYDFGSDESEKEDFDSGLSYEGRHSLAEERSEERLREREADWAEPFVTGSLGSAGEYSAEEWEQMTERHPHDVDDDILAWEMLSGLEEEAKGFARELVQEGESVARASWLLPDDQVGRDQVLAGIVWGTILGPPRCRTERKGC